MAGWAGWTGWTVWFYRGCLAVSLVASLGSPGSWAGTALVTMGETFRVPVTSYRERPFLTVVKQQYDYSCGSAALATLLSYHYNLPVAESDVFQAMYKVGDQARIQKVGFSLLDMKKYLESRGVPSDRFKIPLDLVAQGGIPVITLIERKGYRHFVVIKGINGDVVLVGDPSLGIKHYSRKEFSAMQVDNIVFVIRDKFEVGEANFNKAEDWALRRSAAPLGGQALEQLGPSDLNAARLFSVPSQLFLPTLSGP